MDTKTIERRVAQLLNSDKHPILEGRQLGLEKESLRVATDGGIAQTPHPPALGSALTHPNITTDYSEALLELVTPPFDHFKATLRYLDDTHRFVYSQLEDEILWATSMPCVVEGDASIPIARYGSSNLGQMKTVYRRGLGLRYGRMMQVIAGVHFNYSYPDSFWRRFQPVAGDDGDYPRFVSESYIGMIRNLQRHGWLVPYLFGASPAICASFVSAQPQGLEKWRQYSYYGRYATSLRMSDIGYQNSKEGKAGICVNYNSLDGYIDSLAHAISTPYPEYQRLGVVDDRGEWQQLNGNILQIENEYYSSVRPKQLPQGEEKPTLALRRRGVAYLELRSLDVNAYEPLGISEEQMRFVESLLLFSLLAPSPPYSGNELDEIRDNLNAVAERGRDPALKLRRNGRAVSLRDWADEIFSQMAAGCELLDQGYRTPIYGGSLRHQRARIADPDLTPSARMLADMADHGEEFYHFALRMSQQHQRYFAERPLDAARAEQFRAQAAASLERQRELERQDEVPFAAFLEHYFAQ